MTLTIEIPDEVADRFGAAAAARGTDISRFLIEAGNEAALSDTDLIEALYSGFADADAGRTLTLEEADARFEQDLAQARTRLLASVGH